MSQSILQKLVRELRQLLRPLELAATDPELRQETLRALGLNPNSSATLNIPAGSLNNIDNYLAQSDPDLAAFADVVADIAQVGDAIESFIALAGASSTGEAAEELASVYALLLTVGYLRQRWPLGYALGRLIGLVSEEALHFDKLVALFRGDSPRQPTDDETEVAIASDAIFIPLGIFAAWLGVKFDADINAAYGWDRAPGSTSPNADDISERILQITIEGKSKDSGGTRGTGTLKSTWVIVPTSQGGTAVIVSLVGEGKLDIPLGKGWKLKLELEDGPFAITIRLGEGSGVTGAVADASLKAYISREALDPGTGGKAVLGGSRSTRLEFGNIGFKGELSVKDYGVLASIKDSALVIARGDQDGFIASFLPPDPGLRADFNLGIGWGKGKGIYLEGGSGIVITLSLVIAIGPVTVSAITLSIKPSPPGQQSALDIETSLTMSLKLGPITATAQRFGIEFQMTFPPTGAKILGLFDLTLKPKPPNGVGLALKGAGFSGGGFLFFDPDEDSYAGVLQLQFASIGITAIGLISTRLPGGQKGFSLLIILSVNFKPVGLDIGLGFTINAIGGLLGLNRTANFERLREGVKNNTINSILFPTDPVANAPRIISDLREVFPPAEDRFIFGPMIELGWGKPAGLITLKVGLLIEVPSPVRIAILGVLKLVLPSEELPLVLIQVNFLGTVDFEKKELSFDASLYQSRLLLYILAGDMAVRLRWGDDPIFILSVGGFHPAFTPPAGLTNLRRITISLLPTGDNPRLRMETYFAVTSNTVQFGARIELYAAVSKFNVYGFLGYDVLFQFSPFYFIAQVSAGLAVRIGGSTIMGVTLELTLSGPTPWHARGTASFKILFVRFSVSFDKTFGEERDTALPAQDVKDLLTKALQNKGNWQAELPSHLNQIVTIKDLSGYAKDVLVHPFGTLVISQKLVPLDLTLDKFGSTKPLGANRFVIESVKSESAPWEWSDTREEFAPAQFRNLSDAEKLASKSFERLKSGARINASAQIKSSYVVSREVKYERSIIDRSGKRWRLQIFTLVSGFFSALLNGNAVARSELSYANKARSPLAPGAVSTVSEGFVIVSTRDLSPVNTTATASTQVEAASVMEAIIRDRPDLKGAIQVVPAYEVMR